MNYLLSLTIILATACQNKDHKVSKVDKMITNTNLLGKVNVINTEDPICKMSTKEFLSDTAIYKASVYGFCSISCKKSFKESPENYLSKKINTEG